MAIDYGDDLRQAAPAGSAVDVLSVPTTGDRDRIAADGTVRVGGFIRIEGGGSTFRVLSSAPTYEDLGVDPFVGGAGSFSVATHADLALIPTGDLVVGREWEVLTDGTKFTYRGLEAVPPDAADVDAWDHTGPARYEHWFSQPTATRTFFCDDVGGNDVFNDGSLAQPWRTLSPRGFAQVPDGMGRGILSNFDTAKTVYETVPGIGARFDISRGIEFKFAREGQGSINVVGERIPVDLDGVGTTQFTPGASAVNLTGPHPGGGTQTKFSYSQMDTGEALLPAIQDPPIDATNWIFTESDFGTPGLRFFDALPIIKTHTPAELGASGVAVPGQSGVFAGVTTVVSTYATEWTGQGSNNRMAAPPGMRVTYLGISQGTRRWFGMKGDWSFQGCRLSLSRDIEAHMIGNGGEGLSPFRKCVFDSDADGTGFRNMLQLSSQNSVVTIDACVFQKSGIAIRASGASFTNLTFRGSPGPNGSNGVESRITVGHDDLSSASANRASAFIRAISFEREPGEIVPMTGVAITAVGGGTLLTLSGDASRFTTFDVDDRPWLIGFGAALATLSSIGYGGGFGLPALYRDRGSSAPAVINTPTTTFYGPIANYVTPGDDLQFGQAAVGADVILSFAAGTPFHDVQVGARSGAVPGALDIEAEGCSTR